MKRQRAGALATAAALLAILMTPAVVLADAPVAVDDAYTMNEDASLSVPSDGVLANDSDADGDPLAADRLSDPAHGALTLAADGSLSYEPDADWNGDDSFTYQVLAGSESSGEATVTIHVVAVNDAPVGSADADSVNEDGTLSVSAPGVLGNDSDPEGSALSAILVGNVGHGTLNLSANGSYSYTPTPNYSGSDSFSYRASDGSLQSSVTTVTLSVNGTNDAPVATNDSYATPEDVQLVVAGPGVLGNDGDPDGMGNVVAQLVSNPASGTLVLAANGGFSYTPAANASGQVSFTYRASDGALTSGTATVTITVTAVNDPPTGVADAYETPEDGTLNRRQRDQGVLANDTDAEGFIPGALLVSAPSHGTLGAFDTDDGGFRYTPAPNYDGIDTFTYRATEGTLRSAVTTVTITVTPANDLPVAVADSGTTVEDTPLVTAALTLTTNDSDAETPDAGLVASLVTGAAHGTVVVNGNGSYSYTPVHDYAGSDSFTYRVTDADGGQSQAATVSLTVTPANDAPVATADGRSTNEDATLFGASVLSNDSDVDAGTTLQAVLDTPPARGGLVLNPNGTFTYVPMLNDNGSVTFDYHATDGSLASAPVTVTITINPVNDAPVAGPDSGTATEDVLLSVVAPGVKANDSDVESSTVSLTASLWTQAGHGTATVNANGSWSYTAAANYNGSDSFTYRVFDGTAFSSPGTVSITVTPVNDPPVADADSYAPNEDQALVVSAGSGVLAGDQDVDSGSLSAILVSGPSRGTLSLQSSGAFTYTPAANANGSDSFTYRASDGALQSSVATVNLSVTAVNDPPTFTLGPDPVVLEDSGVASYPGFLTSIVAGPSDETGQSTSVAVVAASPSLFAVQPAISGAGTLTFRPATNLSGSSVVTVSVTDNGGVANGGDNVGTDSFLINVLGANDQVFANSDSWMLDDEPPVWIEAGFTRSLDVLANDVSLDPGETLTIVSATKPIHGSVTIAPDRRTLSYRSTTGYSGSDSFRYTMTDGTFQSSATVFLSIRDTLPPTLAAMTARFETGAQLTSTIKVRVGWPASDPGSGVKSYDVQQSTNGGGTWGTLFSGTTASSSVRSLAPNKAYTFRFRARDIRGRLSAWSSPTTFIPTRYQETTSLATYSSGWKAASISSASANKTKYSKSRGAVSTFTFTGRAVSLVAPRSSSRGKAEIRVDGVLLGTVNLYRSSTDARRHVWSRSWGAVGSHVVSVRVLGTSGHPRFDVDAWTVVK